MEALFQPLGMLPSSVTRGFRIKLDFVLTLESSHGGKVIGDSDLVTVTRHSEFLAIAPDDNS